MNDETLKLWPELEWIADLELREATALTWELALQESALTAADLQEIPFTLLVADLKVSFMAHKRCVVHVARAAAEKMNTFFQDDLPVDMDTVIAGAILADVGKLLEYAKEGDRTVTSETGRYLRHPFTGVSLAQSCGVPDRVCHVIAAHADEGNLVERTVEATIVHHADFMTFLPFKNRAHWRKK
jgi:putative nucleotidyltransferase with HDIG domain